MPKTVSIVEARRELGRLAEEVRRTRRPVILTNRGRAVARIAPEPSVSTATRPRDPDPFAGLRGTVRMVGSFDALERAIRSLRREFARNLARRAALHPRRARRDA
jgi:prevent-host-death family protein